MLTATDVHYLVGFLTLVSSPDNVEIVLGDLVHDAAVGARRDVDVTVKYSNNNVRTSVFKGIEVKKFGRRMDTPQVEQLVAKFGDMPTVSQKAIVSASGFTKGAIRKAQAHHVDLFIFSDWTDTMSGFDHVKFAPWLNSQQHIFGFSDPPHIVFNPSAADRIVFDDGNLIFDSGGNELLGCKTISDLKDRVEVLALQNNQVSRKLYSAKPGQRHRVIATITIPGELFVDTAHGRFRLKDAFIDGQTMRINKRLDVQFKVLIKLGETEPVSGCAMAEMVTGDLVAIVLGRANRSIDSYQIPLSARNQEKIRLLKLK